MDAAKALKSSLCQELETIEAPAIGYQFVSAEDWLVGHGSAVAAVAGEDFSVDDLLDFSNGELEVVDGEEEEEGEEEKDSLSVSSTDGMDDDRDSNSGSLTGNGEDSDSLLASELAVPVDDIADLEWVSHFVDDSLPELSLQYPTTSKGEPENAVTGTQTGPVSLKPPCFPTPVPVKARTKRQRTGTRQTSMSQSSEASSTSSCSTWSSPNIDFLTGPHEEPERKRKKKTKAAAQTGLVQFQRRCTHCLVQKTPQWRTGPLGPKTLCNACGVRYKSGRLFPEYRPACSPTFSVEIHSNSHRKVLEMRRKKEILTAPQGGFAPMVSSF